jgi:hypothetical protein
VAEDVFDFLGLPGPIEEQAETFLQSQKVMIFNGLKTV